ncbi:MAG TPA: alpha-hydroxy-acid oxidizing protein [Roseiarcus sp.]|nr:alpha-hydroxy-acid oxidizing protein [Roseiarcus sp.]
MPDFGAYQNEIYLAGLSGRLPPFPMRFDELEAKAHAAMPASLVSYVAGGCGDEGTQNANVAAFDKWGLPPRMFVGAKQRDLSVELFGMKLPSPLFMSPIGVIGLCAQDGHGDLATARAAALTGVPMVASTLSVDPLEAVAVEFKATPGFFQLYTPTDRDLAASLVRRAEQAGFRAIVVTLDTWVTGWRPRDLATSNFPQLRGSGAVRFRRAQRRPHHQGSGNGGDRRRSRSPLCLRTGARRDRRRRPCAALPVGRSRPLYGGRRLSDARRSHARRATESAALTA